MDPLNNHWIQALARKDTPLVATPEEFFRLNPAWHFAHTQYFNRNRDLDCGHNRNALALQMNLYFQNDPVAQPAQAVRIIMTRPLQDQFAMKARESKTSGIAVRILKFFGNVILNVITIGLYGIIKNHCDQKRIAHLEQKVIQKNQYRNEILVRLRALGDLLRNADQQNQVKKSTVLYAQREIESLKAEIANLPTDETESMEVIRQKIIDAEEDLRAAQDNLNEITMAIFGGEEPAVTEPVVPGGGKGWIKPAYTIKTSDPRQIQGANIAEDFETMEDLLKLEFKAVTDILSREPHFNRSAKVLEENVEIVSGTWELKHLDKIDMIFKLLALNLITKAGLTRTADDARLSWKGLTVRPSQPFWTAPKEVIFKHHDAWTPALDPPTNGVDPVSIKFLLRGLDAQQLQNFILSPLKNNNETALKDAKAYVENTKDAETLMPLLSDVAAMLQDRYRGALDDSLVELFNDENAEPFVKSNVVETVENNQEEELSKIIAWNPELLPIAFTAPEIVNDLKSTRDLLAPIWKNINTLLESPLTNSAIQKTTRNYNEDLRDQYWCFHLGIDGHGCLFSALAVSLLQGAARKDLVDPKRLKEFLAEYLEGGAGLANQELIRSEAAGWGWNQYANFLRGHRDADDRDTYHMGDLEIELLCRALEVHVEVFSKNSQHTVVDGLKNSVRHYGAKNSKERITLYCNNGVSWYSLFPKVRESKQEDSAELKKALNHAQNYWKKNDGIEYSGWSQFQFPGNTNGPNAMPNMNNLFMQYQPNVQNFGFLHNMQGLNNIIFNNHQG